MADSGLHPVLWYLDKLSMSPEHVSSLQAAQINIRRSTELQTPLEVLQHNGKSCISTNSESLKQRGRSAGAAALPVRLHQQSINAQVLLQQLWLKSERTLNTPHDNSSRAPPTKYGHIAPEVDTAVVSAEFKGISAVDILWSACAQENIQSRAHLEVVCLQSQQWQRQLRASLVREQIGRAQHLPHVERPC